MAAAQQLAVLMHGRPLGTLTSKAANHVELRYHDSALADPGVVALSLSLPLVGQRYRGPVLTHWLQGLLPDREDVLRRWRREFGIRRRDVFSLLWHVGEDVAGAAQFVRPDRLEVVNDVGTLHPVSPEQIADRLRALRTDRTAWAPSPATGQFSLAGAQSKFALHRTVTGWAEPQGATPTTHIFKPAIPELADQDAVEHLTMRTASQLGFSVPQTELLTFAGERVLVIQRFDRALTPTGWVRVHQEDMCQAAGVSPDQKYEQQGGPGVAQVAALIREAVRGSNTEPDVSAFLRAVAFNWLIVGTDAHAKNYGLLHAPGQSRLAPLYDLNSFLPYQAGQQVTLAMKMGTWQTNPDRVGIAEWAELARQVNVDVESLLREVRALAEQLPDAVHRAAQDPALVAVNSPCVAAFVTHSAARAQHCLRMLTPPTQP